MEINNRSYIECLVNNNKLNIIEQEINEKKYRHL